MSKWHYPKMAEKFGMYKAKDYYAYLNPVESVKWDRDNKLLERMQTRSRSRSISCARREHGTEKPVRPFQRH
jgi:hypothetical protein